MKVKKSEALFRKSTARPNVPTSGMGGGGMKWNPVYMEKRKIRGLKARHVTSLRFHILAASGGFMQLR